MYINESYFQNRIWKGTAVLTRLKHAHVRKVKISRAPEGRALGDGVETTPNVTMTANTEMDLYLMYHAIMIVHRIQDGRPNLRGKEIEFDLTRYPITYTGHYQDEGHLHEMNGECRYSGTKSSKLALLLMKGNESNRDILGLSNPI